MVDGAIVTVIKQVEPALTEPPVQLVVSDKLALFVSDTTLTELIVAAVAPGLDTVITLVRDVLRLLKPIFLDVVLGTT